MHRDTGGSRPVRSEPRVPQAVARSIRDNRVARGAARSVHARLLLAAPLLGVLVLVLVGCPQRKAADAQADAPKVAPALSRDERSTLFANLARLRLREGDSVRAVDYFRTSVDLSPENPHWYLGLADAYDTSGQSELAAEARTQAARLFKSEGLFVSAVALD